MSCEFINTKDCSVIKAVSILRSQLGEAAAGFSATELREIECKSNDATARKADRPTFQLRHK